MNSLLLMPFCFSGFMNMIIVSGCPQNTVKGRCNETQFCFCKAGQWMRTSLAVAQTKQPTIQSFNDLCICSGSILLSCTTSYYVNEFSGLNENLIDLADENCAVIVKNTTINDTTSTVGSLSVTTVELLTTSTTPSTTGDHPQTEQTTIGSAGQNCCCSSEFEAKVQYWLNETNQRLHRESLSNSLLEIKDELTLQRKNLSASKSLLICAPDQRYSAAVAGYIGAFIIGLVLSLIILMDCCTFVTSFHRCMSK